jgi:hypothetical protein
MKMIGNGSCKRSFTLLVRQHKGVLLTASLSLASGIAGNLKLGNDSLLSIHFSLPTYNSMLHNLNYSMSRDVYNE